MKILFLGQQNFNTKNGGSLVSKSNFEALEKSGYIVESFFLVDNINILSKFLKFLSLLIFKSFTLKTKENQVLSKIKTNSYDIVYLDGSLNGSLAKKIKNKNPNIKIITFFHNIEYNYFLEKNKIRTSVLKSVFNRLFLNATKYQERKSIVNSDYLILLNEREKREILKIYKNIDNKKILIFPIALKDKFVDFYPRTKTEKNILFVGSYFYPNIEGINWFCKEVMPYVDYKLKIVGKGMEILREELEKYSDKIEVVGEVENLDEYYYNSDLVIAPIFSGSGMKTKTIEALMFGKYILGTEEAFQGININDKIGIKCNTELEFIEALNKKLILETKTNNFESRKLFLKEFSLDVRVEKIKKILERK